MLTLEIYLYNRLMSNWKTPPNKWTKILAFLRDCPDVRVGNEDNCRRFIEAVMWMARFGAPRRMLPSEFGGWNSVYKRFAGWSDRGVRRRMRDAFVGDPDMEFILIDSADSEGASSGGGSAHKKRGQESQDLGRSGGGFSAEDPPDGR